ncbi:hypothetical protein M1L56_14290, partial [Agromyces sp. C10]|nr:hypothetical protein [Agromyces sp. C10]
MTDAASARVGDPIRTAVVGFGTSGRVFHAPFLDADPAYSLDVIVTRDGSRRAAAAARHPSAATGGTGADRGATADRRHP